MTEKPDEPGEPNDTQGNPSAPSGSGPHIPVAPNKGGPPDTQRSEANPDPNSASSVRRELHWLEILNFIGQLVLAGVGVVAASIYGCQLSVMRGQLQEMKRSGEQSTDQVWKAIGNINWEARSMDWSQKVSQQGINGSAAQAQQSLGATQAQMRLDQRAWVGISAVDPGVFSETTGFPVVIVFTNSGKTPAMHVTSSQGFGLSPVPVPGPPPMRIQELEQFPGPDIAPQGKLTKNLASLDTKITALPAQIEGTNEIISNFASINDGRLILYYFGTITYDDIFGRPHRTNYCIVFLNPKIKETGSCDTFNDIQ